MKLPRFEYVEPADLDEALRLRAELGAQCAVLAGGTDLLVRMKQGLTRPRRVMSLRRLHDLDAVHEEEGALGVGARTSLSTLCASAVVQRAFPALAEAMRAVGAPSIQHSRGTLGGNLCQDTRCLFYNQSAFWRSGRQPCHKAGGKICYAREGSDRCRSTYQSDGGPALVALGAEVLLERAGGQRTIPVEDLFTLRGEDPLGVAPEEILTRVRIPWPPPGTGSAYQRLAYRSAVDYPVACAAATVQLHGSTVRKARVVVGAVANAPLLMLQAAEALEGRDARDEGALKRAAAIAMDHASAFAVDNVGSTVEYRVQMVAVLVGRALKAAIARAGCSEEARP